MPNKFKRGSLNCEVSTFDRMIKTISWVPSGKTWTRILRQTSSSRFQHPNSHLRGRYLFEITYNNSNSASPQEFEAPLVVKPADKIYPKFEKAPEYVLIELISNFIENYPCIPA